MSQLLRSRCRRRPCSLEKRNCTCAGNLPACICLETECSLFWRCVKFLVLCFALEIYRAQRPVHQNAYSSFGHASGTERMNFGFLNFAWASILNWNWTGQLLEHLNWKASSHEGSIPAQCPQHSASRCGNLLHVFSLGQAF